MSTYRSKDWFAVLSDAAVTAKAVLLDIPTDLELEKLSYSEASRLFRRISQSVCECEEILLNMLRDPSASEPLIEGAEALYEGWTSLYLACARRLRETDKGLELYSYTEGSCQH